MEDDKFLYDGVDQRTKVITFDDCRVNIDFEAFLSQITSGLTVNEKGQKKWKIETSPIFVFTTNHAINGDDNSTLRRQYTVSFSDYYGAWRTPKDQFGHLLFAEWDHTQWNLFYNYIAQCSQLYHVHGLKRVIDDTQIRQRRMRQDIGEDFIDWMKERFDRDSYILNHKWNKMEGYEDFKRKYPQSARFISMRNFKYKLIKWCKYAEHDFNPGHKGRVMSSDGEVIIIANEDYQAYDCEVKRLYQYN